MSRKKDPNVRIRELLVDTGPGKGFGLVYFSTSEKVQKASTAHNGALPYGRPFHAIIRTNRTVTLVSHLSEFTDKNNSAEKQSGKEN